jgi:hypothetical protein
VRVKVVLSIASSLPNPFWVISPVRSTVINNVNWVNSNSEERNSRLYIRVAARAARRTFAHAHGNSGNDCGAFAGITIYMYIHISWHLSNYLIDAVRLKWPLGNWTSIRSWPISSGGCPMPTLIFAGSPVRPHIVPATCVV